LKDAESKQTNSRQNRKALVAVFWLAIVGALLFIGRPLIGCLRMNYRFRHSLHVHFETHSCGATASGPGSTPCKYAVALEGESSPAAIEFIGPNLAHTFDAAQKIVNVTGTGMVRYRGNIIEVSPAQVLFNGHEASRGSLPIRALVANDGTLLNAYCDVSW
jgi:hypothetical protein